MKKRFTRQTANGATAPSDVNLDFGAASTKIPHTVEPGEYRIRVQSARVIQNNSIILIALDLVDVESGNRVNGNPLWVDGPNADSGNLTAENQHLVAQLLTLANLPTSGNVSELIPKLAGTEFDALLVVDVDKRSGRRYNAIAGIYTEE